MSAVAENLLRSKVVAALAWPHRVDRYLELVNPMWAADDVRARVIDVHRENPASDGAQVATITLQPTNTWLGHMAGQHVTVGLEVPGSRRLTRTFSISSAASGPGEQFTLTIRANEDGEVSKRLVNAEVGQLLHLGQAEGEFVLPGTPATPSPHPILMITGGSGITPAMSM
ncbi:MAG TPA: FAD-binding oxidoreductase, partial [Marmoricola sp.]|nr:FAD-binding oxidoreductase [Marmoricola sp.]